MKQLLVFTIFICIARGSYSQLYMPRNVAAAYKNGTRAMNGKPGKNYWQNHADYKMDITAVPPDSIVSGTEEITYFNESPDTIKNPVFRLFLNIHKAGAPRDIAASANELTAGMTIDSFVINGKPHRWKNNPFLFTWMPQDLPTPLRPKDSVHFIIKWHYEISKQSNREGKIDSTTYFLAYFYPRLAVYDDCDGWDKINFVDTKEFYSDFNNYSVAIHVPKNYIVWGTGTLQQPETVLQPEVLKRFQQSLTTDAVINIATQTDIAGKKVTVQNAMNRWNFISSNIPDVAFAISNHYVWDGCSTVVDDATGRRASAQAAYNDTAKDFHRVAAYARYSLNWLSHNWPGIPYPYEKTTIVQGYAGMEYPMMANNDTHEDTMASRSVAEHEIAHTYMPFYMGINESRYGFMDEGWANTFEYFMGMEGLATQQEKDLYRRGIASYWTNNKTASQDIPVITPVNNLTGPALYVNQYVKPELGYLALKDLLGDSLFRKCLHAYMERWNGKHPLPWDFFNTFNDVAGKDLNWFWDNWFFSRYYIDLSIQSVDKSNKNYAVTVSNPGGMAAPFNLLVTYADGTSDTLHQTPVVWEKNQKITVINVPAKKRLQSIRMDGEIFVDTDDTNNQWKEK